MITADAFWRSRCQSQLCAVVDAKHELSGHEVVVRSNGWQYLHDAKYTLHPLVPKKANSCTGSSGQQYNASQGRARLGTIAVAIIIAAAVTMD
jgi:hypothetical protein